MKASSSQWQIFWPLLSFLPLLFCASCAIFFGPHYDDAPLPQATQERTNTCQSLAAFWAAENPSVVAAWQNFNRENHLASQASFIERAVLWSLLQMNVRPDLASPAAHLQIVVTLRGQEARYYAFAPTAQAPYLAALKYILQRYPHQHSLASLAALLDRRFKDSLTVDASLALFLAQHPQAFNSSWGKKYFFKGGQILRQGESLPKMHFYDLVMQFKQDEAPTLAAKLYPVDGHLGLSCSQDLAKYQQNDYQIAPEISPYHFFAFTDEAGNSFMAASSLRPIMKNGIYQAAAQFTLAGEAPLAPAAICLGEQRGHRLQVMAADDRDPAQHLMHLIELNLTTYVPQELERLNQLGRYLFLQRPPRLLVESARMPEEQIEHFLAMNFPLYHVRQMGHLWFSWQRKNQCGIITDSRHPMAIYCPREKALSTAATVNH